MKNRNSASVLRIRDWGRGPHDRGEDLRRPSRAASVDSSVSPAAQPREENCAASADSFWEDLGVDISPPWWPEFVSVATDPEDDRENEQEDKMSKERAEVLQTSHRLKLEFRCQGQSLNHSRLIGKYDS